MKILNCERTEIVKRMMRSLSWVAWSPFVGFFLPRETVENVHSMKSTWVTRITYFRSVYFHLVTRVVPWSCRGLSVALESHFKLKSMGHYLVCIDRYLWAFAYQGPIYCFGLIIPHSVGSVGVVLHWTNGVKPLVADLALVVYDLLDVLEDEYRLWLLYHPWFLEFKLLSPEVNSSKQSTSE